MTWDALGMNPAPGDADRIRAVAAGLGSTAEIGEALTLRLSKVDGALDDVWRGDVATTFQRRIADVRDDLGRLVSAHREAEDAVTAYSHALEAVQLGARRAAASATTALLERNSQRDTKILEQRAAADHENIVKACATKLLITNPGLYGTVDPAYAEWERQVNLQKQTAEKSASAARRRALTAADAETTANQELEAARVLGLQAQEVRQFAARRAVRRLDSAGMGGIRRSLPVERGLAGLNDRLRDIATGPDIRIWIDALENLDFSLHGLSRIFSRIPLGRAIFYVVGEAAAYAAVALRLLTLMYGGDRSAANIAAILLTLTPGAGRHLLKLHRSLSGATASPSARTAAIAGLHAMPLQSRKIHPQAYFRALPAVTPALALPLGITSTPPTRLAVHRLIETRGVAR